MRFSEFQLRKVITAAFNFSQRRSKIFQGQTQYKQYQSKHYFWHLLTSKFKNLNKIYQNIIIFNTSVFQKIQVDLQCTADLYHHHFPFSKEIDSTFYAPTFLKRVKKLSERRVDKGKKWYFPKEKGILLKEENLNLLVLFEFGQSLLVDVTNVEVVSETILKLNMSSKILYLWI